MDPFLKEIEIFLLRELAALAREVDLFPDDGLAWKLPDGITNSAGTLVLHSCGNLRHFIGHVLAGSDYVRDRHAEFHSNGLSREELASIIQNTVLDLKRAFPSVNGAILDKPFPVHVGGVEINTRRFLLHLCTHLSFHVGQLGYLRRILTRENVSSGAIDVKILAEPPE